MTDFIREVLTECSAGKVDGDWVFTRTLKNGKQEHVVDFRDNWDRAVKAINHPDLIFHELRRTGACNMVEDGILERTVMEIAGWETLTVLHRYLKARGTRDQSDAIATMNLKRKEREEERKKKEQERSCHVPVTVEQNEGQNAESEKRDLLEAIGGERLIGRGGGTRTPDPRIRNPMLYPAELHPRKDLHDIGFSAAGFGVTGGAGIAH